MVLFEVGEAVDYGKEFADVVGSYRCFVVEELLAVGYIDALVFHHTRIAAAGSIDGQTVEFGTWHRPRQYYGHAIFVHTDHG